MRIHRLALVAGWVIVSLLAVAGFAAFAAPDRNQDKTAQTATDLGENAGALSALSFTYLAETTSMPASGFDIDAAVRQELDRRAASTTTTTAGQEQPATTSSYQKSRYLSEIEVRQLVAAVFRPEDVNHAVRVAWCESSFNPYAIDPGTGAAGLFQLPPASWSAWAKSAGVPGADMLDPQANVAVAAWVVYHGAGWSQFGCRS